MGSTRRTAAVSVLLALEQHRKQVGLRLTKLREANRWTQTELAYKSGVSTKTISRIENGHHDGRRDTIRKLAKAFGVTETDILGEPPAPLGLVLGAREDQVEDVRGQFEELVTEMTAAIEENQRTLAKILDNLVTKEMVEAAVRLAARPARVAEQPSASSRDQDDQDSEQTG